MTAAIDPRLRARRAEVAREAGRRRLRVMFVVASCFVAGGCTYLALESPLLDVDHVRVHGLEHLPERAVIEAAGLERGEPMYRIDTAATGERLEALAWVADADVVRDFPGTVRIEVRERAPVAFVRRDGIDVALVDADGRVIDDVEEPPPGATEVIGVRRVPEPGALLSPIGAAGVVTQLPPALAEQVVAIDVAGEGVALDLGRGGEVRLGDVTQLDAKAAAALAVLERLGDTAFEYVDVRSPANPVAR